MKITFLGTGPSKPVPANKDGRTNSSVYIRNRDYAFIIDCSDDFAKQAKRENINRIDFVLQTHAHKDCMGGLADQLKNWMQKHDKEKMPIYCEKRAWNKITERIRDHDHLEPNFIETGKTFKPKGKLSVKPFRLKHSIQEGFPTVGFRFNNVVYSEDVGKIPEDSEKYYKNADIIIFDAAMWFDDFIKGHHNVNMALDIAKKYKPGKFILTQAGHTYPPHKKAEKEIQDYWNKEKEKTKTDIILAKDGLTLSLNKHSANIFNYIRKIAADIDIYYWIQRLEDDYGLSSVLQEGVIDGASIIRQCHQILSCMPMNLIKECNVKELEIRSDMGESRPLFPNHGFYVDNKIALNFDIFIHPDKLEDPLNPEGYPINRDAYTLIHEFGHCLDEKQDFLSEKPEWLKLSGWTQVDMPYLKQLVIKAPGLPDKKSEWFYHPDAKFCRFYSKANPGDDFSDCFSFFFNGLKDKIPLIKKEYFNKLFSKYSS